jgi:hypothetical protein
MGANLAAQPVRRTIMTGEAIRVPSPEGFVRIAAKQERLNAKTAKGRK